MLKRDIRPILFVLTTKLKRYKLLNFITKVILSPFYILSLVLYGLSRFAELVHDWIENGLEFILMKIVHIFEWNEAAQKQNKTNPEKFVNKKAKREEI
jgi:hypothetical protein